MKKSKLTLVAVVLSGSLLFSSCVGSFGLFNRLSSWNQGVFQHCSGLWRSIPC